MLKQGFSEEALAIVVRNVGRLPASVTDWGVSFSEKGWGYSNALDPINPALPYRLEPGSKETWYVRMGDLRPFPAVLEKSSLRLRAHVSLGTGKTVKAKGSFIVRPG